MPTLEQLINSLKNDRATVVTNLNTKGVEASTEETFTELAPKILDIPTGDSSIRKVATVAEMNAIQNPNKGDICLVYNNTLAPLSDRTAFNSFHFPTEVQLDHAIDSFKSATFSQNYDMMSSPCQFSMNTNYISFNLGGDYAGYGENSISYIPDPNTPNKWILNPNSTKGNFISGNTVTFPEGKTMSWDGAGTNSPSGADMSDMFNFIYIGDIIFNGLYQYDGTTWNYLDINIGTLANKIFEGAKGYTNNGTVTGTLGTSISAHFDDDAAVIYAKAQQLYDATTPIILAAENDRTFRDDYPNITTIPKKTDGTLLADFSNVTNASFMFNNLQKLLYVPALNTTNSLVNCNEMFENSKNLVSVALFNTSGVTNPRSMFAGCTALRDVPAFNLSSVTGDKMAYMFSNCPNLSDDSLNNILTMCINSGVSASNYKKLSYIGFTAANYPASRIQALSKYTDFTNAGWTIGY